MAKKITNFGLQQTDKKTYEIMELIEKALEFENRKHTFKTTSERIESSREVKDLILSLNTIYKKDKDPDIMDLMKRLTAIKQKIEKRLKGRP
ncbi:hypothetical protein GCM10022260_21060 [Gaetbulibacter aestuarii]